MRVLHILSQRPLLTGSGVTLDALVRHAAAAGWEQRIVVGVPASDEAPRVGGLPAGSLTFEAGVLGFPVPGMSDVMPYRSTRFSAMTDAQLERYRTAWRARLEAEIHAVRPDVIHAHHLWIVGSMVKEVAPDIPVVSHCHSTGLRQMELCPALVPRIVAGLARNDAFLALHRRDAARIAERLQVETDRVHVVGAGYDADVFHAQGRQTARGERVVYAGKYSAAKGLPQLLDAVERLAARRPNLRLEIAGSGSGPEADALAERMSRMPAVRMHGNLEPRRLAELFRSARVSVLPSYYEGVPLVLVEAAACGCRLVATDLPGVVGELLPQLDSVLTLVEAPPLVEVDRPDPDELPRFVDRLERSLDQALDAPPAPRLSLDRFTWAEVFARVERCWRGLV